MSQAADSKVTSTLKCIARRQRPSGKGWVRCNKLAVRGDQFCPLHLAEGRKHHKNIRGLLIDVNLEDEDVHYMTIMAGVDMKITKVIFHKLIEIT